MSTVAIHYADAEIVHTADEWAAVIKADLTHAVEGIVSAGRNLIQAKADVSHGEWMPMLKAIGISDSYARKLMLVARNLALSDRSHENDLPANFTALYELSRLEPEVIEEGIASGDISPSTTIRDAREFARNEIGEARSRREPVKDSPFAEVAEREAEAKAEVLANRPDLAADVENPDVKHPSTYRQARALWLEQDGKERRKREQEKKDYEDGVERDTSRVRTFLAGYDQAYSLAMGLVPDRDALLGGLSPKDRTRFERIESETTWPTTRL